MKRMALVTCLAFAIGLLGCGGESLVLSGAGEVSIVVQTSGSAMNKKFVKDAFKIMQDACRVRGWELSVEPVSVTLAGAARSDKPIQLSARKDDVSVISETVERVFRWFPSQAVTLSGCCVYKDDKGEIKKACPAPKKKPDPPSHKTVRPDTQSSSSAK